MEDKMRRCNYECKWIKECARWHRDGSNLRSWCLPDLMRHGFVEKVK